MNAQRLVRQLRRELKAHPKRAMLLAGLTAVGIYFWAPLVAGWIWPDKPDVVAAPAKKPAATASAGNTNNASQSKQAKDDDANVPWTKLWAAIRDDLRTKPAKSYPATVDPFRPFPVPEPQADEPGKTADDAVTQGKTNAQEKQDLARVAASAEPTPRSLGMKLTGTVVGLQSCAAVIDGNVFAVGATVAASAKSSAKSTETSAAQRAQPVAFRLARVEPQAAFLERNGKSYKLVIEVPDVTGTDFAVLSPPPD
jgi:hypothetical protein